MMQKERRATIAQEQVRAMKESMPTPPTTVQSWRKQFINAVVGGHAGKGKQLVVAIMLLSDDELIHVSGLETLAATMGKTRDAATNTNALSKWLTVNTAAVVKAWEKLEFPDAPEYLESASGSSGVARKGAGKVVIFDLDQTLTTVHVDKELLKAPVDRIFGGQKRVNLLEELFGELCAQGTALGVCSFNSILNILRALEMRGAAGGANLLQYFDPDLIYGHEITDDLDERDKGVTVRDRIVGKHPKAKVLFVDDTHKNCMMVVGACKGVDTMTVAGVEGLVESECNTIRKWALHGGSV